MPLLSWKPEYSVGEMELDSDHMKFFEILNTAYENVMSHYEVESTTSKIDELLMILRHHISAEEQYLMEKGYHDIDSHMTEHRQFIYDIEQLKTSQFDSNLDATKEMIVVLGNLILHHILIEDKKYQVALS